MESAKTFLKEKVFYLIGGAILATSGWYNAKILVQEKFNELKKQGFDVHKSQIRLPNGPNKTIGDTTVAVSLHTDVDAEIIVAVYGETA